jgi:hypothetical protein
MASSHPVRRPDEPVLTPAMRRSMVERRIVEPIEQGKFESKLNTMGTNVIPTTLGPFDEAAALAHWRQRVRAASSLSD